MEHQGQGGDASRIIHRMLMLLRPVLRTLMVLATLALAPCLMAAQNLPFKLVPAFVELEPLTLAPAERQWLAGRGTLKVGISIDDYQPIDITRDRNRYQGISADYLSLVGERLACPWKSWGSLSVNRRSRRCARGRSTS